MEDLVKNLKDAKEGNVEATEKIIKRYSKYINYMMNKYQIIDKNSCKDEIISLILNLIQELDLKKFIKN